MTLGIIYKLVHKNPAITNCYVGRTTKPALRHKQHMISCNNEKSKAYNYKVYKTIRDTGGFDNWNFVEIETIEYDPNDLTNIKEREAYWYKTLGATLNNNIPNQDSATSKKNWMLKNKNYYKEYNNKYRIENKEHITERHKQYYLEKKDQIKAYTKKWVQNNRDKNRAYQRERYHKLKAQKEMEVADLKQTMATDLAEKAI